MKKPNSLWNVLASELGGELGVDTSRDRLTVSRRVEHEGESFLTITLPTLRKAFERSLDLGQWDAHACTSFKVQKGLPAFLRGFLELVFNKDTGAILDNPNTDAIRFVRQLTGMFGSLLPLVGEDDSQSLGCSDASIKLAFESYVKTDFEVASHDLDLNEADVEELRRSIDAVFSTVLRRTDLQVYSGQLIPRHSGGATADRLKGNQKWTFPEWTDRLEEIFPFLENTVPSASLASHRLQDDGLGLSVHFRSPEDELPVRVIAVPKTAEKPRIISIEPSYVQYMQQAVLRDLDREFMQSPGISQMIQLHDRCHNQRAARMGSIDGSLATLDLKDASDRLSWHLVQRVFRSYPWLVKAMDATRSRVASVPTEGDIRLSKFAGMGSALTFPVQTMVFTAIVFVGIARTHGTTAQIAYKRWARQVRVFGDDIIIPSDSVPKVVEALESYGFRLNAGKSFWTGKFRESCGGEYYSGEDVSYVKVRRHLPNSRNDVESVVSTVALRNRLYEYGYWRTATWLDDQLADLFSGSYPTVSARSQVLGRMTYLSPEGLDEDPQLQVPQVRGFVVQDRLPVNAIDGVDAVTRYFFESEDNNDLTDPLCYLEPRHAEEDRFNRSGRPTRATLKRRTRPF